MEFEVHNLQKIKLGVHIAQGFLMFISWAIEIAVFRSSAIIDGRPGWYFGLVCLSLQPSPSTSQESMNTDTVHTVLPHYPSHHLPYYDPPLSSNPKIRKPKRLDGSRCYLHLPLAICLLRTS